MSDPSDLNRPYNSSVQVTSAWLNAVSDRLLNPTKTDWRQWSDADLDTSPGSLADRFAKYSDQLRVTVNVGRVVSISPGYVGLSDGSTLEVGTVATSTPASLTMPDDTTLKVFVTPSGVAYGSAVPVGALYLADVTTAGGYVLSVVDKRSLVSLMASANGALEDRLDTLGAALGSVETSVDFSAANDGDIIRVGSNGGLVASDPFSATGINASFIDGFEANFGTDAVVGQSVILGTGNNLVFGAAPASSLGDYTLNIPDWKIHETLVRSPLGDVRPAGGLRLEYGSDSTNFVFGDRRYAFDVTGTTTAAVFPRPSRKGEFIEITNLGTSSALTLDFRTNAIGTSVGNGLLGTGATEVFIATGTSNTTDWWTFAQPSTIGSAATGAGGSSGGGSASPSSWASVQSSWLAVSQAVSGGLGDVITPASSVLGGSPPNSPSVSPHFFTPSNLYDITVSAPRRIPTSGGVPVALSQIAASGTINYLAEDESGIVALVLATGLISLLDTNTNTITPVSLSGLTGFKTATPFANGTKLFTVRFSGASDLVYNVLDRGSGIWTEVGTALGAQGYFSIGYKKVFWGSDDQIWILRAANTIDRFNPATSTLTPGTAIPGGTMTGSTSSFVGIAQSGRVILADGSTNAKLVAVEQNLSAISNVSGAASLNHSSPQLYTPIQSGELVGIGGTNSFIKVSASGLTSTTKATTGSLGINQGIRGYIDGRIYWCISGGSTYNLTDFNYSLPMPSSVMTSKFLTYKSVA